MRYRLIRLVGLLAAAMAFEAVLFAQTYGTPGYAPGAWKPEELPKDLAKPKSYDAHDLAGVWVVDADREHPERHTLTDSPGGGPSAPTNFVPPAMTDWAKAIYQKNIPSYGPRRVMPGLGNDPVSVCDPLGYPRALWEANLRPFEFIQGPDRLLMHMQYHESWRTIWEDGRQLPKDPDPAWLGYSVGRWEGDTFVIESTGYDERTWVDHYGTPHSDQMHVEERWRRLDADTLQVSVTITDPKAYTKPWVMTKPFTFKKAQVAIFEEICAPSEESSFNNKIRDPAVSNAKH